MVPYLMAYKTPHLTQTFPPPKKSDLKISLGFHIESGSIWLDNGYLHV